MAAIRRSHLGASGDLTITAAQMIPARCSAFGGNDSGFEGRAMHDQQIGGPEAADTL